MSNSARVEEAFSEALAAHAGCRLVVGFSGGLDSTVLLSAATAVAGTDRVTAFHVHHGLVEGADTWLRHCESVCAGLGVRLESEKVSVAPAGNLEEAARTARYACWQRRIGKDEVLLLGHHLDDQAETLLLRLVRGAGAALLRGMPKQRTVGRGTLVRPFLDLPRVMLERYAHDRTLTWIEDPTNADTLLDRNYLRHEVLPVLARRWPDAVMQLGESAGRLAEDAELAAATLDRMLDAASDGRGGLSIEALCGQPFSRRVLRHWLERSGIHGVPDRQLDEILRQASAGAGASPQALVAPHRTVRRHEGALVLVSDAVVTPAELTWCLREPVVFGDATLRAELVAEGGLDASIDAVMVRPRAGGERLRLRGRAGTRSVKRLLAEAKVPEWRRGCYPLVYVDDSLAAVPGIGVADGLWRPGPAWQLTWD